MKIAWILALAALMGCAPGAYTSVRTLSDGTYLITRNTVGAFNIVHGALLRCRVSGENLQCAEVGSP